MASRPGSGFGSAAVREGGSITVIHRADRLADILALLAPKAGSAQVRPVLPFADQPAKRVLVRAIKSGKAPMRAPARPRPLHDREGGRSNTRRRLRPILRGQAGAGLGLGGRGAQCARRPSKRQRSLWPAAPVLA